MEEKVDLRKDQRFKAGEDSVAALNCEISSKFGIITDISRGGLAFRYLALDFEHQEKSKPFEVNIFRKADGFSLFSGPCKVIKDNYTPPEYSLSLGLMRKCSIQFGELTFDQKSQLDYFIAHFTKGSTAEPLILPPLNSE